MARQVAALQHQLQEAQQGHEQDMQSARQELQAQHQHKLDSISTSHRAELQALQDRLDAAEARSIEAPSAAATKPSDQLAAAADSRADPAIVQELLEEVDRLQQEKGEVEAQADELAASLAAERRRTEKVGLVPGSETGTDTICAPSCLAPQCNWHHVCKHYEFNTLLSALSSNLHVSSGAWPAA